MVKNHRSSSLLQPVQRGQQRIGDFFQVVAQGEADPGASPEGVEYLCIYMYLYVYTWYIYMYIYIHTYMCVYLYTCV